MKTYLISEKILNEVFYFFRRIHSQCLIKRLDNLRDQLKNLEEVEHNDDYSDDKIMPSDKNKNVIYKGNSNLKVKMTE